MKGKRYVKCVGGDEEDGLSFASKRFYHWAPGVRKQLKRKFNRRERQALKRDNTAGW